MGATDGSDCEPHVRAETELDLEFLGSEFLLPSAK